MRQNKIKWLINSFSSKLTRSAAILVYSLSVVEVPDLKFRLQGVFLMTEPNGKIKYDFQEVELQVNPAWSCV